MDEIPSFLSGVKTINEFDYEKIADFINSEIDHSTYIHNLSIPLDKKILCQQYFKSILGGYSHLFIEKLMKQFSTSSNICLPLLHKWEDGKTRIDNLVIISHPDDAERICKNHIKKTPIFTSFLFDSLISTTDNHHWKQQRDEMNIAFVPILSLRRIFPISQQRANQCSSFLKEISHNYTQPINMSEFFLHETQAQLQLSMFGFSEEFQDATNKKIRNAFSGIHTEYTQEFSRLALQETQESDGPLSKLFDGKLTQTNIGNILIYAFAGHDTTGHTLTWLLYELCKHPEYKQELIREIDNYWSNHETPTYKTFNELPFMTRCLTETLRLWPALANGTYRELESDETIHGIDGTSVNVPKGTYCQIINWTRHRNKELWGEDADIFNPHREFTDSEIWNHEGFGTFSVSSERYSPFTYGPRNCIGKNFSHMEMRLILLYIFKSFDFALSELQMETVDDPKYKGFNTFTMGPKSVYENELVGMYAHVIPRSSKL